MGLRDLFINNDDNKTTAPEVKVVKEDKPLTKFPTTTPTETSGGGLFGNGGLFGGSKPTTMPVVNTEVSNEHLQKAIDVYQRGFESLNQDGYDFYEYYQAVVHGGVDNPQIHSMAFAMGVAMNKSISKEKLLQQSDFYTSSINNVYNENVAKGNAKKEELVNQKTNENQNLINELNSLQQQLEAINIQISDRKNKLNAIDGKYAPLISETESKIGANDIAKNQLIESIELVKTGIINNLK